jgi:hypothetical protein
MANTLADRIVVILVAPCAKLVYGIILDSLNGLTDTIHRQEKIGWVHEPRGQQFNHPLPSSHLRPRSANQKISAQGEEGRVNPLQMIGFMEAMY